MLRASVTESHLKSGLGWLRGRKQLGEGLYGQVGDVPCVVCIVLARGGTVVCGAPPVICPSSVSCFC